MTTSDVDCAVLGAGAAGLAAATMLRAAGRDVIVLEAATRAGGSAWTERREGYLVERGANAFRIGPGAHAFLRATGLESLAVAAAPTSRERFLVR
jgi:phytoene dehydrogenase-like protein